MNFRLEGFDDTLSWRGVPLGYMLFTMVFYQDFWEIFSQDNMAVSKNFTNILEDNAFFLESYTPSLQSFLEVIRIGLDWSPISTDSLAWLGCLFLEEEIYNAMFQLNKEKGLMPNGFTIPMYQDLYKKSFHSSKSVGM